MSLDADLGRMQRWLQAVVTHPDGAAAGALSEEARRHLDVPPGELDRVVRPSSKLTAEQRLDLYHRGYRLRLLESLRAVHPVLRHALGTELFDAFALEYLQACPSRSYTLFRLGEGFPD